MSKYKHLFMLAGVGICLLLNPAHAENSTHVVEKIRKHYLIPELNYAVISSTEVLEIHALGFKKKGGPRNAELSDRFRIGSNTKTVTSYIASNLIQQGVIDWHTRFFDLYPELATIGNPAYQNLTLLDLLSFRAPLQSWTYTDEKPSEVELVGNSSQQRYLFMKWILQQTPKEMSGEINFSNPAYVAAGLMLEKASGKTYEQLIEELGHDIGIYFGFGQPNYRSPKQTWGHDAEGKPEASKDNKKLNWLSSAGNLNVTLPDYVKYIQLHLKGLKGDLGEQQKTNFRFLHFGRAQFAIGWNWYVDPIDQKSYSWHRGNPGTFFTKVIICLEDDRAYLFFTNASRSDVEEALDKIFKMLRQREKK